MPLLSFYTAWKHQENLPGPCLFNKDAGLRLATLLKKRLRQGFVMFSDGVERELWHEMG